MRVAMGAPLYKAPELVKRVQGSLTTEKVDIWAIGVMVFYMLSFEKFPFPGIDKNIVNAKILGGVPEMYEISRASE